MFLTQKATRTFFLLATEMLLVRFSNGDGQTVLIVRHTIFVVCMDCMRPQELLQLSDSNASVACFPVEAVVGTLLLDSDAFGVLGSFTE